MSNDTSPLSTRALMISALLRLRQHFKEHIPFHLIQESLPFDSVRSHAESLMHLTEGIAWEASGSHLRISDDAFDNLEPYLVKEVHEYAAQSFESGTYENWRQILRETFDIPEYILDRVAGQVTPERLVKLPQLGPEIEVTDEDGDPDLSDPVIDSPEIGVIYALNLRITKLEDELEAIRDLAWGRPWETPRDAVANLRKKILSFLPIRGAR